MNKHNTYLGTLGRTLGKKREGGETTAVPPGALAVIKHASESFPAEGRLV